MFKGKKTAKQVYMKKLKTKSWPSFLTPKKRKE